jgi:hypothetical protein
MASNKSVKDAKGKEWLHAADGVHLNELGHLAMAWAILKGLDAPADVSSVAIDVTTGKIESSGCTVRDVKCAANEATFTRFDQGLPLNQGIFFALNYRFVPIFDELNRYMLKATGLADGKYEVKAGGRKLGVWTSKQLANGINICSATSDAWQPGGPWNVQANMLKELTDARSQLSIARLQSRLYQSDSDAAKFRKEAADINERLEALQGEAARPRPYRFEIRRVKDGQRK